MNIYVLFYLFERQKAKQQREGDRDIASIPQFTLQLLAKLRHAEARSQTLHRITLRGRKATPAASRMQQQQANIKREVRGLKPDTSVWAAILQVEA